MFAFGDKEWPGLSKLVEECGEVVQVCGKLMGTGGVVHHWDGTHLKIRLEQELADLSAAIMFVQANCNLDADKIRRRAEDKIAVFDRWHREQKK